LSISNLMERIFRGHACTPSCDALCGALAAPGVTRSVDAGQPAPCRAVVFCIIVDPAMALPTATVPATADAAAALPFAWAGS
jgi:hypothetical protein